jgi:2,5-dioxopentanoate dehydrogenase
LEAKHNPISGGDFAAALAAHNPVIAKGNPGHPSTTRLLAQIAHEVASNVHLHPAAVQLIYDVTNDVGLELVSHPLVGATSFTGSTASGLKLKSAADTAGKPIYLEMSSINPVIILPGALLERGDAIAEEFFQSCTVAAGQFCTKPGLVIVPDGDEGRNFVTSTSKKFVAATPGILVGRGGLGRITEAVAILREHGAKLVCGGIPLPGPAYRFANTLLSVSAEEFLRHPSELQTEAFGPVSLIVLSSGVQRTAAILKCLGGSLAGTIYSGMSDMDDPDYEAIEGQLRQRVGRLINNRMPTGVAVSPAMNHGGPFPATGHPGFTAVGMPASIQRFAALHC